MCWSAIGRAKLMMIGSPTPTVEPLTGLKVGGTNGGEPVNGSGFCPTTGPVGAACVVAGGGGRGAGGAPPRGRGRRVTRARRRDCRWRYRQRVGGRGRRSRLPGWGRRRGFYPWRGR